MGPWGRPFHVSVVDPEAPSSSGFWNNHAVGEPSRVCDFSNDLCSFSFSTSLTIKACFSRACFRAFCFTGQVFGHTTKWCSITSLGTPDISDGVHANMSEFARRKVTSALSYLGGKTAPMLTLAPEPPAPVPSMPRDTFFVEACSCWKSCFFLAGL